MELGSAGGGTYNGVKGGAGGGAIRLEVGGTLQLDGEISADGGAGARNNSSSSGGGSGGSIWINTSVLSGTGWVTVLGGDSVDTVYDGGGGSGGRVAIYYEDGSGFDLGQVVAHGGSSAVEAGAAGTVYTKSSSQAHGELVLDNNGLSGGTTPLLLGWARRFCYGPSGGSGRAREWVE